MTATQDNLANLSKFIFETPRWYTSTAFSLLIAAIVGVAAFETAVPLRDAWQGVFFIGLPTVVAAFLTAPIDRVMGGQLSQNQASLLAMACELVVVGFIAVAGLVAIFTPYGQEFVLDAFLTGLAFIFALRLIIVTAVSRHPLPLAAVPASLQTVAAGAMLAVYSGTTGLLLDNPTLQQFLSRPDKAPIDPLTVGALDLGLLALMCLIYGVAVWGFLAALNYPWRSSLGVSGLDFLRGFIAHLADESRELEAFFEAVGDDAVVPVTVFSIRRPSGEEKARFVLPMIHPGPMGEIGGGNLPKLVAREAEGVAFPPHATAGHDFNLVSERELDPILSAAQDAYERIEYSDTATQSIRVQEGEATLTGQAVDGGALAVATFAPGFADDVEYGVGLSALSGARNGDIEDILLVDAHNSNNGLQGENLGHVVPGSERSFDLIEGARRLTGMLAEAERGPLSVGVAWRETDWGPEEGIGPLGVRVAVFEVAGQTTAYVLIDGNNMEPGLRRRIFDAVGAVDRLEVMTTDTHVVNIVEPENQVGDAIEAAALIDLIEDLVDEAVADLEPVEAGMATERAGVTVFGNDRTETMASTANAVVSVGSALAAAWILGILAISGIIFLLSGA